MKNNLNNPQKQNSHQFGQKPKTLASAQAYLPISEIKDGLIVLKDGSLRAVLLVAGTNFGLRSQEEQQAIIVSWQHFLNSLDFPIQIVVRSKKVDLSQYLQVLEKAAKNQKNELLRYQTESYIEYLKGLIDVANVVTKEFYVVVPYYPSPIAQISLFDKIASFFGFKTLPAGENFESSKAALFQRVEVIKAGLENIGLKVAPLSTEQLIDLFYNVYNPDIAYFEKLTDIKEITPNL